MVLLKNTVSGPDTFEIIAHYQIINAMIIVTIIFSDSEPVLKAVSCSAQ